MQTDVTGTKHLWCTSVAGEHADWTLLSLESVIIIIKMILHANERRHRASSAHILNYSTQHNTTVWLSSWRHALAVRANSISQQEKLCPQHTIAHFAIKSIVLLGTSLTSLPFVCIHISRKWERHGLQFSVQSGFCGMTLNPVGYYQYSVPICRVWT